MPSHGATCDLPARPPAPADPTEAEQRRRVLAATARLVAAGGYGATTVNSIVAEARVGKETFYRCFEDREHCYLELYDEFAVEATSRIGGAFAEADRPWPERVARGLSAFIEFAQEQPAEVAACIGEPLAAGAAATSRYEDLLAAAAGLLRLGRSIDPRGAELPESLERTLAGGVAWMFARELDAHGPDSLDELLPDALRLLLAPYIGDAAADDVARRRR